MYAKTKELGPVGGVCTWHTPPRSANGSLNLVHSRVIGVYVPFRVEGDLFIVLHAAAAGYKGDYNCQNLGNLQYLLV